MSKFFHNTRAALALITALVLVMLLGGCAQGSTDVYTTLAQKGLTMTTAMDELVSSEAFRNSVGTSQELNDVIGNMGKADYTKPKAVYRVTLPASAAADMLLKTANAESSVSSSVKVWLSNRIYTTFPTQLAAKSGALTLAATASCAYSSTFVLDGVTEPILLVYQYDGAYCPIVTFIPGQDASISASACFVPAENGLRDATTAEEIAACLSEGFYVDGITAEPISVS